eukprot:scaffold810_cov355-Pavlova_lutheri.AAC.22
MAPTPPPTLVLPPHDPDHATWTNAIPVTRGRNQKGRGARTPCNACVSVLEREHRSMGSHEAVVDDPVDGDLRQTCGPRIRELSPMPLAHTLGLYTTAFTALSSGVIAES